MTRDSVLIVTVVSAAVISRSVVYWFGRQNDANQPVQSNRTFRFLVWGGWIDSNRFAKWIESNRLESRLGMLLVWTAQCAVCAAVEVKVSGIIGLDVVIGYQQSRCARHRLSFRLLRYRSMVAQNKRCDRVTVQ